MGAGFLSLVNHQPCRPGSAWPPDPSPARSVNSPGGQDPYFITTGWTSSHVLEALMDELNRHGAFADGRGDALHGAGPHIAGREDAWPAGLQQKRLPPGSPVWGTCQFRPGPDEPLRIPLDFRRKPTGSRVCADKTENSRGFYGPFLAGLAVNDIHRIEVAVTAHLADGGVGEQFDVGGLLNPPHQI